MTILITTDLDRTLLFSRQAIEELGGDRPAVAIETTTTGRSIELAQEALQILTNLPSSVLVVPVTTRTPAQLARPTIPGLSRYAIAANGAIVLIDGQPDPEWSPRADGTAGVRDAELILDKVDHGGQICRRWVAIDQFIVAILETSRQAEDLAVSTSALAAEINWVSAASGRKLYLMPRHINKADAVRHLCNRLAAEEDSPSLHLAAGDNPLDLAMLELADAAWVPRASDLARNPKVTRHQITEEPGHGAAVEICSAWAARINQSLRADLRT